MRAVREDCLKEFEGMKNCVQENAAYYEEQEELEKAKSEEQKKVGKGGWSF